MSAITLAVGFEIEEPPFPEISCCQVLRVEKEKCSRRVVALCGCSIGVVEESTRCKEDFNEGPLGKAEAETVGEEGRRGVWGKWK